MNCRTLTTKEAEGVSLGLAKVKADNVERVSKHLGKLW